MDGPVIDDLHELHLPEGPTLFTRLLTSLPPNVHAILTTRHDVRLRLSLHRLRLAGELAEIRATDLFGLDLDDAAALAARAPTTDRRRRAYYGGLPRPGR